MASGETILVMVTVVELTLGRRPLKMWVFVAEVTDEFIPGLDAPQAYNASENLGRHLLQLGQEEVMLWRPNTTNTFPAHLGQQ
jgi:hypothetical protein